jgi:hypothetical protein
VLRRARGSARARQAPVGVGVGRDGRRSGVHGGARLVAMGGGEHGIRGRFTHTREGLRRVAGHVRGNQGRGVLLHPQLAMRLKVPGHGEATAAWFGQSRRRRPTRGEGLRLDLADPGLIRARWGARQCGRWIGGVRAQARTRTRPARRGAAGSTTGNVRRTRRH